VNHLISIKILCKNQWIWSYPRSERISRFGYDQQLNIREREQTTYVCVCVCWCMYVCIAKTTINTLSCQTTRQEEQKVNKIIRKWASKNIFKSATAFCDDSFLTTERIPYYSFLVTIKKRKTAELHNADDLPAVSSKFINLRLINFLDNLVYESYSLRSSNFSNWWPRITKMLLPWQ
jgi:hypothetical protein